MDTAGTGLIYSTATTVDRSGTITTGGVAQALMPANAVRRGWYLRNNSSGSLYVNGQGTASTGPQSLEIKPGELYETPNSGASGNALSIYGATTGQSFTSREW
jgi:hypothetical protein